MITLYKIGRRGKSKRQKANWWLPGTSSGERKDCNCLEGIGFSFRVMKMFWNQIEVLVAQHYKYTK